MPYPKVTITVEDHRADKHVSFFENCDRKYFRIVKIVNDTSNYVGEWINTDRVDGMIQSGFTVNLVPPKDRYR